MTSEVGPWGDTGTGGGHVPSDVLGYTAALIWWMPGISTIAAAFS